MEGDRISPLKGSGQALEQKYCQIIVIISSNIIITISISIIMKLQ